MSMIAEMHEIFQYSFKKKLTETYDIKSYICSQIWQISEILGFLVFIIKFVLCDQVLPII